MSLKLKPVTRLSIVFLLAIVLSGSVLTYFSINNISNLKELTEKKVIEEQREIYAGFSAALQYKLDIITAGLGEGADQHSVIKDTLLDKALEYECIIQPFILNKEGEFVYPRFEGIPGKVRVPVFSQMFRTAFSEGEKSEFSAKDLRKAEKYYQSCLVLSTTSSDSVKAMNALGRIAVKMDDTQHALSRYKLIVSDYYSESDENGYPYVYYALPQLLKIAGRDNSDELVSLIGFSLEQMNYGLIPLNYFTGELLSEITDWFQKDSTINQEQQSHINVLTENLDQQLQLVNTYGSELKEVIGKVNHDSYYSTSNNFKIINSQSGDNHEFFLVNTDLDVPAGFLIDRIKLFDTLVIGNLLGGFDFDYLIEFPEGYNLNNNGQNLLYSSQLNPYFPGQFIRIRLADEDLISDIVKRRSWIYGIASVLLLVAMVLGVALILRDIAREKHLARMRADFISNVTHELKTPLTSIRMYAESMIMGRAKSEEKRKEYLEVVVHESDRLKGMINNILEFSKMEKGTPEYHFGTTDLASIIKEATAEMSHWFSQEGFEISTELEENISADVDPEKIKQALINLFSNAIKYSPDTRIIFIRLFRDTDKASIEVEDRGIGIPDDKLLKIFEPFYRIVREEGASGTGLGLTVVKEIIEAHKGTVSATSEIGKGSKFKIQIPLGGK